MQVSLRINNECNFACKYCNVEGSKGTKNTPEGYINENNCEISKQTIEDVIGYCKENEITSLDIPQKEPFYNPELLEYVIERFNQTGIRISDITTNLYNLPVSAIRLLKQYNISLLGSFDGLWQDDFRILPNDGGTSSVVEKNIFALKGAGIRFSLACCVVHDTVDRIYENYKYLLRFTPGVVFNFDVSSPYRIRNEDIPIIEQQFKKIAKEPQGLNIFPLWKIKKRIQQNARYSNHMCGAGRGSYTIDWDGTIYPCYHTQGWKRIGINLGSIYDGINKEEKDKFYEYDSSVPEQCRKCSAKLCGICYVNSFDVMGNMTTPIPVNCKIFSALTSVVSDTLKKQKTQKQIVPPVVDFRKETKVL